MMTPAHLAHRANAARLTLEALGDGYWAPRQFWPTAKRADAIRMAAQRQGEAPTPEALAARYLAQGMARRIRTARQAWTWAPDRRRIHADTLDTLGSDLGTAEDLLNKAGRWRLAREAGGWYVDSHCQNTMTGHVVAIRHAKGLEYVPATACPDWDGVTLYLADAIRVPRGSDEAAHDEAIIDAAWAANEAARIEAEAYREDEAAYRAGEAAADRRQAWRWALSKGIATVRDILAEARRVRGQLELPGIESGEVCRLVREARDAWREAWADGADDLAAWHDACHDYLRGWRTNNERASFCDGAGLPRAAARLPGGAA